MAKEYKSSKNSENGKTVNHIAVFFDIKQKVDKKFKWTYLPCVKLPPMQIKEIQKTYLRLGRETLTLLRIPYFLQEELNKKESDAYICYYHIDNFYHRIYVIEQMIDRLIVKLFMAGEKSDKDLASQLNSYGYKDIAEFLKKFSKDTKKIRDRRARLVHRTGSSAEEIANELALAQFTDKGSRQILAPDKVGQEYCKTELRRMSKISMDYLAHIGNFLLLVDHNIL